MVTFSVAGTRIMNTGLVVTWQRHDIWIENAYSSSIAWQNPTTEANLTDSHPPVTSALGYPRQGSLFEPLALSFAALLVSVSLQQIVLAACTVACVDVEKQRQEEAMNLRREKAAQFAQHLNQACILYVSELICVPQEYITMTSHILESDMP